VESTTQNIKGKRSMSWSSRTVWVRIQCFPSTAHSAISSKARIGSTKALPAYKWCKVVGVWLY